MTEALDALADLSARLRAVPDVIANRVIPSLADDVAEYLRECAAKGIDPDGKSWPKTERGRQALITGTKVSVGVIGSKIYVRVAGHDAMHSTGTARGKKVRGLLPRGPIPPPLAARMRATVLAELDAAVRP